MTDSKPTLLEILKDKQPAWSVFLDHWHQIQEAVSAGYSKKQIHNALAESTGIDVSYQTFLRWVAKLASESKTANRKPLSQGATARSAPADPKPERPLFAAKALDDMARADGTYRDRKFEWPTAKNDRES